MNLLRHYYRSWIVPYAEGTLDARRRDRLEMWLAHDPVLAAEAEAERRVVARLRDAAQGSESTFGEKDLWPGIHLRLEPRRSLIRPLILVGGLSAAATSLAWATLLGPLHHPVPSSLPAQVLSADAPNVIVIETPPGRRHGHPGRRPRHSGEHLAKILTTPLPRLERGPDLGRSRTLNESRVAHNGAPVLKEDGSPTVPPSNSGGDARFHLATTVRPAGGRDVPEDAPSEQDRVSATDGPKTPGTEDSASGRDKDPNPTSSAAEAPTLPDITSSQTASSHVAAHRHGSRRRRRRSSGDKPAGSGMDKGASVKDTAVHPKALTKPID